mmetsp:Transcript_267/g.645  ORF Transcript_267/g.645 Transcript_267/m.645 type:complete len:265 (+) Transcript_267:1646-2440(+)|eukprot:CAMPEP_0171525646 /NCGR_PEP_ID=MMETSP0959-20130129/9866_1 /TAXON_ID=87120 /ORGANISM="Aurantiochytrium limacinum, Strain ATCCMYA-1381" /LENGTH=264 /DNA_ID=CAMNT_0012066807 /DNA_START=1489 /DNA_END=2280 /DNA_ORIENTATION=+
MALCYEQLDQTMIKAEEEESVTSPKPDVVCEGTIMKALKADGLAYASSMDLSVWNVSNAEPAKKRKQLRTVNIVASTSRVDEILKKHQNPPRVSLQVSIYYEAVPGYTTMHEVVGSFTLDLSDFVNEAYHIAMTNKASTKQLPKKNSHHVQFETDVDFDFDGFAQLVKHFITVELGVELGIKMKYVIEGTRVRIHKSLFHSVTNHATPYIPLLANVLRTRKGRDERYLARFPVEHSALQVFYHVYPRISDYVGQIATTLRRRSH